MNRCLYCDKELITATPFCSDDCEIQHAKEYWEYAVEQCRETGRHDEMKKGDWCPNCGWTK